MPSGWLCMTLVSCLTNSQLSPSTSTETHLCHEYPLRSACQPLRHSRLLSDLAVKRHQMQTPVCCLRGSVLFHTWSGVTLNEQSFSVRKL